MLIQKDETVYMPRSNIILVGAYSPQQRERLETRFITCSVDTPQQLMSLASDERQACAAVACHGHSPFGAAEMDALPSLRLIANFGVGYDDIDIDAATSRGITVTNTPNVLNDDVADLAVGMYLALKRRLIAGDRWVRSGDWARIGSFPLNAHTSGLRVGILGMGRIGKEIADRMVAFKTTVHYQSRQAKQVPSDWVYHADAIDLARSVDVLFVTLVGGDETRHFVSAEVLSALPSDAVVINVSRGTVIDEDALIQRLQGGFLAGAALDVFATEPHVDPRLCDQENVLLQPHQGSGTINTRESMGDLQYANILAFTEGNELITAVN